MKRKSLNVKRKTWKKLNRAKSKGQSFDGFINELLTERKERSKE